MTILIYDQNRRKIKTNVFKLQSRFPLESWKKRQNSLQIEHSKVKFRTKVNENLCRETVKLKGSKVKKKYGKYQKMATRSKKS